MDHTSDEFAALPHSQITPEELATLKEKIRESFKARTLTQQELVAIIREHPQHSDELLDARFSPIIPSDITSGQLMLLKRMLRAKTVGYAASAADILTEDLLHACAHTHHQYGDEIYAACNDESLSCVFSDSEMREIDMLISQLSFPIEVTMQPHVVNDEAW